MDNLQRKCLLRFNAAQEKYLAINIEGCLEDCLELRLKPDLAFYTRAIVCLTICDMLILKDAPDKLDFVLEALRLVTVSKIAEYERLEKDAERRVEHARAGEREQTDDSLESQKEDPEENMGETSSVGGATKYGPEEGEWFPVEDDRDDDTELVGMPPIENLFTVVPSTILHEEHTRDERGDGKDSDGKSSNRATTKP